MRNRSNLIEYRKPPKGSISGFTLIEVMVGVAIFAVLSALIVGAIQSNSDRNAKLEAQRFIAVLNEVRDDVVISGKTVAMTMDEKGLNYRFSALGGNSPNGEQDSLFRTRKLHTSVKLKLEVFADLNDDDEDENDELLDEDEFTARVLITPLGELTPFQVRFGGEDDDFIVELNNEGVLQMDIKPSNFF